MLPSESVIADWTRAPVASRTSTVTEGGAFHTSICSTLPRTWKLPVSPEEPL